MKRDKNAFSLAKNFIKQNIFLILAFIIIYFLIGIGFEKLSDFVLSKELTYVDYSLAVVRMFIQTVVSFILIFIWYKKKETDAKFSVATAIKLFFSTLLVSLALVSLSVTIVGIPFAIWLFLRFDFYINIFFTTDNKGIISPIRESFKITKGHAKKYLVYNIKYLAFYYIIMAVLLGFSVPSVLAGISSATVGLISTVFTSIFTPYKYLLKCGFYDEYLSGTDKGTENTHTN